VRVGRTISGAIWVDAAGASHTTDQVGATAAVTVDRSKGAGPI